MRRFAYFSNFIFDEAIVLNLVLALLSRGVSYHSDSLTIASYPDTCVGITLDFGGIMQGVLT